MNRRQFLVSALSAGGGLLLVGCGGSSTDPFAAPLSGSPTVTGQVNNPDYLTFFEPGDRTYRLFPYQHRIERVGPNSEVLWAIDGPGQGPGQVHLPRHLVGDENGLLYLLDSAEFGVSVWNEDGQYIKTIETQSLAGLAHCDGELFVPGSNFQIQVYSANDGSLLREFGSFGQEVGQFYGPGPLVFDEQKRLHVIDHGNGRINVFDTAGLPLYSYGQRSLRSPLAIASDKRGQMVVVDGAESSVVLFGTDGRFLRSIDLENATGQSLQPLHITTDFSGRIHTLAYAIQLPGGQG